ncbi:spermine oxidase-like isoform X2 [Phymastichus coffea]|uniref:spermine oxidase-like isoform X2 n=1 Tax=Phymastichus coffea TaxID=108790 RepID=UPI00273ABBAD|nr:spermine oxidase-like isoform X2 [Phymastichus coffea]
MDIKKTDLSIENTEIVIVGAGIAGLGAAITLEQSDFKEYILLEAQSQVGGRIASIPWKNGWLELGAQFLHGRESTLAQLAEIKGLLSCIDGAEGEGLYLRVDGSNVDQALILEVDDIVKNILEDCEKYALNNEIEYSDIEENIDIRQIKEELFDWNVRFLLIDNACMQLDELSVKSWGKFKSVNGPEYNIFNTHYGAIVESITRELSQDNIRLNCPVTKIEWNDKIDVNNPRPITITLENNKKINTKCAIITSSLGFLKENHDKLFIPMLPKQFVTAIQSLGFGLINKVFLEFSEPWWEPNTKGFQFLWNDNTEKCNNNPARKKLAGWAKDLTGFDVIKDQKSILLGWVGGKGACVIETLSEQQIIKDCAEIFRFFLKNENVPEASKCIKSTWFSNRYVKGGYSHISKKCDIAGISPATLAKPIWGTINSYNNIKNFPILMLAGEATHDNYYSTTHGAYDSGVKQAQIFLKHYRTE